jgi:hypothetical protein
MTLCRFYVMIFSRLNVYEYNLYSFLSISDRRNKRLIKNAERPLLDSQKQGCEGPCFDRVKEVLGNTKKFPKRSSFWGIFWDWSDAVQYVRTKPLDKSLFIIQT